MSKAPDPQTDLLPMEHLKQAAECLKCVAHPHRLRIIEILLSGEYTVDTIARLCALTQPATSGHLRLMEGKGLLHSERRGRTVYYTVCEPQLTSIIDCVRNRFKQPS
ncbi:MAG: metalloregulator ArsR/SmtB family transcription factor [Thiotrichales bacterium]|nr:metalloregulator ArsR/SmtB family transcription factor [Thiotrichales bacterium]